MIDLAAALERLMRFLAVEGITGEERAIAKEIQSALRAAGLANRAIHFDNANERIPLPTQTGNLIVSLPGTRPGPHLLFMTHMDTVPLCAGAKPLRKGNRIVPEGPTALGGDNRTGCAVLVMLAATLLQDKQPHPPITLLFTVREESGLFGARHLEPAMLDRPGVGKPVMCFNVDGKSAAEITVGAVGADRWEVKITGKAAHAGVHPERGISASMVAALGMAEVYAGGWFGKVVKDGQEGTSNVGSIGDPDGGTAGAATNVVTEEVLVRGESRSHDPRFVRAITAAYKKAFQNAATRVKDDRGRPAKVRFNARLDYLPFRLRDDEAVVQRATAAVRAVGREPHLRVTNGGLDANWLVRHGIPTITFGAGQNDIHTTREWVDLTEFESACRLAVELATAE